ncbi:hypothetical protein HBB16_02115 [Pseudonocardia sp. MCCB 268]|nr:hypothetical protein [Pseudonocardia cytotoxica]
MLIVRAGPPPHRRPGPVGPPLKRTMRSGTRSTLFSGTCRAGARTGRRWATAGLHLAQAVAPLAWSRATGGERYAEHADTVVPVRNRADELRVESGSASPRLTPAPSTPSPRPTSFPRQ